MPKTLLMFAQTAEARATIAALGAQPCPASQRPIWGEGNVPTLYRFSGGSLVISNLGLHAAAAALATHVKGHSKIFNIGFAGALNPQLVLLDILPISTVSKWLPALPSDPTTRLMAETLLPPLFCRNTGYRLLSSDLPLHDHNQAQALSTHHDLIDMEGYSIAHLAAHFNLPCSLWKIVSDFASEGGRSLIAQNKELLSQSIASHIIKNI